MVGWISRLICLRASNVHARGCNGACGGFVVIIMFVGIRMESLYRFVDALSPQIKSPINKSTFLFIDFSVLDDDRPGADSRLTPDIC